MGITQGYGGKLPSLHDSIFKHLSFPEPAFNFPNAQVKSLVAGVTTIPGLTDLTRGDGEMAEVVTGDILTTLDEAGNEIESKPDEVIANEKEMLEEFKKTKPAKFDENWEKTEPYLKDMYSKEKLDTSFYEQQFKKSLNSKDKKSGKGRDKKPGPIMFKSVRTNMADKWEGLVEEKQKLFEQKIIKKHTAKLQASIVAKMGKLKELVMLLAPFELKTGKLFDLAKGEWKSGNLDIVKKYADLLKEDKSLQELADMMGRVSQAEKEYEEEVYMRTIIVPEYRYIHGGKTEIKGVMESDDIPNMISSEIMLLCDEDMELLFLKKFVEKKLQTFEYQGKELHHQEQQVEDTRIREKDGIRGPYILCVDTSGSMSGEPEVVCKVLAFALTKRALQEKRKCYLISFSTDIMTFELTDIADSIDRLLNFLSMSFNGGTDAEPALTEAVRKVEQDEGFKKADILMLSDFCMGDLDDKLLERMKQAKENKTKFNSLVISSYANNGGNQKVVDVFDNNWNFNPMDKTALLKFVSNMRPAHPTFSNNFSWPPLFGFP